MRTLITLAITLAACGEPSMAPQPKSAPAPDPVGSPEPVVAAAPEQAPSAPAPHTPSSMRRLGKVLEVLPVDDRYTYARMDACGTEAWVAGPAAELKVGQTLVMEGGAVMANFESKTLKRTFDQLLMINAWKLSDEEPDCSAPVAKPAPAAETAAEEDLAAMTLGIATEIDTAAGYTFVKLEYCGDETWIAGPETPVKKGDKVGGVKPMIMKDFFAKSLGRKFPEISFIRKFKKINELPPCKL